MVEGRRSGRDGWRGGEGVGCAVVPVCGEDGGGVIGSEEVGVDCESVWVHFGPWRPMRKAGMGSIYWMEFGVLLMLFGAVISWSLQRIYGFI